jgi:hypothetical protein
MDWLEGVLPPSLPMLPLSKPPAAALHHFINHSIEKFQVWHSACPLLVYSLPTHFFLSNSLSVIFPVFSSIFLS